MGRRRLQQKGDLYKAGGFWKLRWMVDAVDANGKPCRKWSRPVDVGPCDRTLGMEPWTEKKARREAWERFLSKVDQNQRVPLSMMTVEQFVNMKFIPGHVAMLKKSGRSHYQNMLKHLMPAIGHRRLCDIRKDDIQGIVSGILSRGLSWQTAKHVKTCASAVFTFAEAEDCYQGTNPAKHVRLPEENRKEKHALTYEQVARLVEALPEDVRNLVLFAIMTSMNIAEICGLCWKRVNLSSEWITVDGEAIPPMHIAVRRQWYRGQYETVKVGTRKRNIPIPELLQGILVEFRRRPTWTGPEDPVFAARNGQPVDEHNIARRKLKPVAVALGMHWISWHVFRHTHSTWTKTVGLPDFDRMQLMGHGSMSMTDRYTAGDTDRRRGALDEMARLLGEAQGRIQ